MFDEIEKELRHECGVFGIFARGRDDIDVARTAFYGLYALQHRGQESAGIAVSDGRGIKLLKGMGLVTEVIRSENIKDLDGYMAIGHVRYSTTGASIAVNAQPLVFHYLNGMVALAHNGNLVNAEELRKRLATYGSVFQTTTDTEVVANLLARYSQDKLEDALAKCMIDMKGAYALLIMTEDKLIGVRDPLGIRPLCLGSLDDAYVLASESAALDTVGATFIRDVEPGEIVVIDDKGLRSLKASNLPYRAHCVFEYIYFARPDSTLDGINVYKARRELGRQLARENLIAADLVISVPDSGTASALGYADEAGLPFEEGLMKNRYVGRTFIQPTQQMRELGVKLKLNAIEEVVKGKRIIMIDDSIVRGTTSKKIIQMLRDAGAVEIHMLIASPPTRFPCFYGIDTSRREELIANKMDKEAIREFIGADSLYYISMEGMFAALKRDDKFFCTACFSGDYPVKI
ncbi:amidophosphoribosyltransferase [Thermosyntropha lipolytica DSM 11003]|uniref:Amidophosphoribosyltransferase n=1 Tax=Thermosyntropha lipolytica DSM 11003 TaxID=1123382 RepID=A0A1M5J9X0_9FIRM|nr:amidophosphoribosyltransferase [Thermosyntropha lipolytica]SHG37362.1 amidophosphoribosyltransferase [Thermosyntropha lipolytica DSM 11003]